MAAPAGLEPANAGVKVLCLTDLAMGLYKGRRYLRKDEPLRFPIV